MNKTLGSLLLCVVSVILVNNLSCASENVGTSTADAPSLVSKLQIENKTDHVIEYSLHWGNGQTRSYTLNPNTHRHHQYPIKDGHYPTPHVAFVSNHRQMQYHLEGYEVGYNGYGANPAYSKTPKYYEFAPTTGKATSFDLLAAN